MPAVQQTFCIGTSTLRILSVFPAFLFVLQIDQDTNDLLRSLNMVNLPGVKMVPVSPHTRSTADVKWLLHCFQCCQSFGSC